MEHGLARRADIRQVKIIDKNNFIGSSFQDGKISLPCAVPVPRTADSRSFAGDL